MKECQELCAEQWNHGVVTYNGETIWDKYGKMVIMGLYRTV